MSAIRLLRVPASLRSTPFHPARSTTRLFSAFPSRRQDDKKDSMLDREKMNTESNEYSKSGSDAAAATEDQAAFDPDKTSPESQKNSEGKPLEVSPGNHDVSQARDTEEGGSEKGVERTHSSGGGSPSKGKKVS